MPLIAQNQTTIDVVARPTFAQNYFTSSTKTSTLTSQNVQTSSVSSKSSTQVSLSSMSSQSGLPNSAIESRFVSTTIIVVSTIVILLSIFLNFFKYKNLQIFEKTISKD